MYALKMKQDGYIAAKGQLLHVETIKDQVHFCAPENTNSIIWMVPSISDAVAPLSGNYRGSLRRPFIPVFDRDKVEVIEVGFLPKP